MMKPLYVFLFIFPLAGALSLGALLEEKQSNFAIPVAIVDEDDSDYSRIVVEGLKKQDRLQVRELSFEEADRLLARNELDSVFVIKEHFQKQLLAEERESTVELITSSVSMASGIVKEVFASEVTKLTSAIQAANRVKELYNEKDIHDMEIWQEAYEYTLSQWNPEPLMTVSYKNADIAVFGEIEEKNEEQSQTYLGLWTFFVLLSCFVTSDWIVKERGPLFSRMLATEIGVVGYFYQTAVAHVLFYCVQTLVVAFMMDSLHLIQLNLSLFVSLMMYILFSLCISLSLGSVSKNVGTYYAGGIFISFIIVFMGEGFFPVADLSSEIASLSQWFPQTFIWLAVSEGGFSMKMMPATAGVLVVGLCSVVLIARRLKSG